MGHSRKLTRKQKRDIRKQNRLVEDKIIEYRTQKALKADLLLCPQQTATTVLNAQTPPVESDNHGANSASCASSMRVTPKSPYETKPTLSVAKMDLESPEIERIPQLPAKSALQQSKNIAIRFLQLVAWFIKLPFTIPYFFFRKARALILLFLGLDADLTTAPALQQQQRQFQLLMTRVTQLESQVQKLNQAMRDQTESNIRNGFDAGNHQCSLDPTQFAPLCSSSTAENFPPKTPNIPHSAPPSTMSACAPPPPPPPPPPSFDLFSPKIFSLQKSMQISKLAADSKRLSTQNTNSKKTERPLITVDMIKSVKLRRSSSSTEPEATPRSQSKKATVVNGQHIVSLQDLVSVRLRATPKSTPQSGNANSSASRPATMNGQLLVSMRDLSGIKLRPTPKKKSPHSLSASGRDTSPTQSPFPRQNFKEFRKSPQKLVLSPKKKGGNSPKNLNTPASAHNTPNLTKENQQNVRSVLPLVRTKTPSAFSAKRAELAIVTPTSNRLKHPILN